MRNGGSTSKGGAVLGLLLCLAVVTGCGDDDGDDAGPRATVPETTTSTAPPTTTSTVAAPTFEPLLADPALTVEEQVEAAYLFSWEIYLDAVERGDPTFLPLAYADEALEVVRSEVERYVANGQRRVGDVSLSYTVNIAGETEAAVLDAYTDDTILIAETTGLPVEDRAEPVESVLFRLELKDGAWKVTRLTGYSS